MIRFDDMPEEVIPQFRGGKGDFFAKMFFDGENRIMKGRLACGSSIGLHTHDTSSEIIYILSGTATFILDGAEEVLSAGDCHYCKKGSAHTLMNRHADDLVFFAVVPRQ